jgi:hypothetical protein
MGRVNLSIKRLDPNYKPSERDNKPLRGGKPLVGRLVALGEPGVLPL